MSAIAATSTAYPFTSRWFSTPQGRMHYVDEGSGPPIVFVHGMPTWSFLWRRFIARFARTHRAIAVDHLGFGRSDKPVDGDYHPRVLSENLSALIDELRLSDITLVVHDFGGPIGLGHTIRNPHSVSRLAIFNTWMWSLTDHRGARQVDRVVSGWLGHVMYRWFNASTRLVIPKVLAPGHRLDPAVHRAYIEAAPTSASRAGQLALARNLVGASDWYDELWQARAKLADKPAALVWGMQDPTFGPADLERWQSVLPHARIHQLPDSGHFPQEEAPEASMSALAALVEDVAAPQAWAKNDSVRS